MFFSTRQALNLCTLATALEVRKHLLITKATSYFWEKDLAKKDPAAR